jgi:hypothetical protein
MGMAPVMPAGELIHPPPKNVMILATLFDFEILVDSIQIDALFLPKSQI